MTREWDHMTRAEVLALAKQRALVYADRGDATNCLASMTSDCNKHPDLADHAGLMLGVMLTMSGHLTRPDQLRKWVEDFN